MAPVRPGLPNVDLSGRPARASLTGVNDGPAAYGFALDEDLARRLRGEPPARALRWVEAELGGQVVEAVPLAGGTSSAVHQLSLRTPDGALSSVVLRRYVLDWVVEEPWIPVNEARILRRLSTVDTVPAPRLLAADPHGAATGTPTIVMSVRPGAVVWWPTDLDAWLRSLVEVMVTIHAIPVVEDLDDWRPYPPEPGAVPPPWTRHAAAWQRALALFAGPRPQSERVFVHRDFHPGNVLWTGDQITGVIDWVSSCAGPPEEDVGHCRVNLAQHHGMAAADRFLALWLERTGRDRYDPYWDLTNVVSMAGTTPDESLDSFVSAAAART